jgi:nucleotide-binding universal stress UspA family protein
VTARECGADLIAVALCRWQPAYMALEASLRSPLVGAPDPGRFERWDAQAPAPTELEPSATTGRLVEPDPRAGRSAPDHSGFERVFGAVLCAIDGSVNAQAARRQASALATPGGTVTTVASSLLARHGSCALPDGWECHDLLVVGAGAAGLAAAEHTPIPLLLARRPPLGVDVTDSIVVAVDASPEADRAVQLAGRLAATHGGDVTIVVAPRCDAALGRAIARSRRLLQHATGAVPAVVDEPRPPERTVPAAAAALAASLVVLPSGHTRRDRRIAARVAGAVGCSVLLMPAVAT